jgi:acyl carrier protein
MSIGIADTTSIEEQIYRALRTVKPSLNDVALEPSMRFDALGLESLERAIVVFEIEDAYEIGLVDSHLDRFHTIAEARDVVSRLLAKKSLQAEH